jgi:hypothetical protein
MVASIGSALNNAVLFKYVVIFRPHSCAGDGVTSMIDTLKSTGAQRRFYSRILELVFI